MPVLTNPRWEKFAQGLVSGLSQHAAFVAAGYQRKGEAPDSKNIRSDAAKLKRNKEVRGRIAELQLEAAKDAKITLADILKEVDAAIKLGHRSRQAGAVVGAVGLKAKLRGFVIDRTEIEATLRKPSRRPTEDRKISLEEWKQKFAPKQEEPS